MNILLVDDEVLAIQYIAGLVDWQANGYQICAIAHSVAEAKQALETMDINIVLFVCIHARGERGVSLILHSQNIIQESGCWPSLVTTPTTMFVRF